MNVEIFCEIDPDVNFEVALPRFLSYYETINHILSITKWVSLAILIIIPVIVLGKKVIRKQPIKKNCVIILSCIWIIALIAFIVSLFVRMSYWY